MHTNNQFDNLSLHVFMMTDLDVAASFNTLISAEAMLSSSASKSLQIN